MEMNDINSLSPNKWNCKYHIVFVPQYRKRVYYKQKQLKIGKILLQLCEWKDVKIIEAEACSDHIHLFIDEVFRFRVHRVLKGEKCCNDV